MPISKPSQAASKTLEMLGFCIQFQFLGKRVDNASKAIE